MYNRNEIIAWLLKGDVSIQYQTHRDLFHSDKNILQNLQKRIETEGWGAKFLALQRPDGHWGIHFYQPKWTSTHYTILDLKNLGFPPGNIHLDTMVKRILNEKKCPDGGIDYSRSLGVSDVCLNGMVLNYGAYFRNIDEGFDSIIENLLKNQMSDGGWNCENYRGAVHSSLHTTLSVLEGFLEYRKAGGCYRLSEIKAVEKEGVEFILKHRLYKSHRTGEIIKKQFLTLSYPSRWKYDILRCLDFFNDAQIPFDERMSDAIEVLLKKRGKDGRWNLQANHPGQVHFAMEQVGQPSRWNTLRAMRALEHFGVKL